MLRKVALVGVPSLFPGRGGIAQLFWGLLVCFSTFGAYMMYAPFKNASDDTLSQLAQLQIFLTLLSSMALRETPPSEFVGSLVTYVLFIVPGIGLYLETPLVSELNKLYAKVKDYVDASFPNLKFERPSNVLIDRPSKVAPEPPKAPDEVTTVTELVSEVESPHHQK